MCEVTFVNILLAVGDHFLRCLHIPDSITGKENKLGVVSDRLNLDIWECRYHLVLCFVHGVVFVFKVTKGSGEGKHTIDAPFLNKATSIVDSCTLLIVLRFVILGKLDGNSLV